MNQIALKLIQIMLCVESPRSLVCQLVTFPVLHHSCVPLCNPRTHSNKYTLHAPTHHPQLFCVNNSIVIAVMYTHYNKGGPSTYKIAHPPAAHLRMIFFYYSEREWNNIQLLHFTFKHPFPSLLHSPTTHHLARATETAVATRHHSIILAFRDQPPPMEFSAAAALLLADYWRRHNIAI